MFESSKSSSATAEMQKVTSLLEASCTFVQLAFSNLYTTNPAQNRIFQVDGVQWENDRPEKDVVEYVDKSGNVLKFRWFEGFNITLFFSLSNLKQIKTFKFKPGDVYLPGFPRTGTNLTTEIAQMLLNGKAETIPRFKPHIEMMTEAEMNKLPSPKVINAHVWMTNAPDDVRKNRNKVIFTLRDPKDVIVSMYVANHEKSWSDQMYRGSFDNYLGLFLDGKVDLNGIFEHWRVAERFFDENPDIPVHFMVYEDTLKKPVESIQNLSDFLGLPLDIDLCREIAEKCQFSRMKVDKDPYTIKMDGIDVLYRKGQAGDWKNFFTEENLQDYYRVYDEKMAGSRFYQMYAKRT